MERGRDGTGRGAARLVRQERMQGRPPVNAKGPIRLVEVEGIVGGLIGRIGGPLGLGCHDRAAQENEAAVVAFCQLDDTPGSAPFWDTEKPPPAMT